VSPDAGANPGGVGMQGLQMESAAILRAVAAVTGPYPIRLRRVVMRR